MPDKKVLADFLFRHSPLYRDLQTSVSSLAESGQYGASLLDTVQLIVVVLNNRLQPVFINAYGLKKLDLHDKRELASLRLLQIIDRDLIARLRDRLKTDTTVHNQETQIRLPGGRKICAEISISTLFSEKGMIKGYLTVITDTTTRRRAEENLRNQIQFSQQIFQAIPEMIVVVDRHLKITYLNKKVRKIMPEADILVIGQSISDLLPPCSMQLGFDELIRNVIESGKGINRINIRNPFLEEESYVDMIVEPLRGAGKRIGAIILLRDISEWRNLTAQFRSLQGFLEKMLNASPFAVISISSADYVMIWNSAAERFFGLSFESVFGRSIYEVIPAFDEFRERIDEVRVLNKSTFLAEERLTLAEHSEFIANLTFYPVAGEESSVVIHIEDISAVKQMESSLMQVQKMESLGFLTSGIVHDFNNVLSGILGYASLLENKIKPGSNLRKYVKTLMISAERASNISRQMLDFTRKKKVVKEIVDLNETLMELLGFLKINLRNIELRLDLCREKILIRADRTRISQILINLIVNARDALQGRDSPYLLIRTKQIQLEGRTNMLDGNYVQIEIEDNGCGISKETQARIFEPFFTTKKAGKGTGLGLAILKDLLHDLHGDIEVQSEIDAGTVFRLYVPVLEKKKSASRKKERDFPILHFSGTVLVVDDEEIVREIASDMLNALGLSTLTAADGSQGIELFTANREAIDLVILDIEMPVLSGEKAFARLREIDPDVKILVASGYSKEYLEKNHFKAKIEHFMAKPFQFDQLSYQLQKLLGQADA